MTDTADTKRLRQLLDTLDHWRTCREAGCPRCWTDTVGLHGRVHRRDHRDIEGELMAALEERDAYGEGAARASRVVGWLGLAALLLGPLAAAWVWLPAFRGLIHTTIGTAVWATCLVVCMYLITGTGRRKR